MASQPANTSINVLRRLRSQRADRRHDSVRSILSPGLRELVMAVPSEEVRVLRTRDSVVSDRYRSGHFVTVYNRDLTTYAEAVAGLTGIAIPFQIGRDKFIEKTVANAADDIHQDLRDVE